MFTSNVRDPEEKIFNIKMNEGNFFPSFTFIQLLLTCTCSSHMPFRCDHIHTLAHYQSKMVKICAQEQFERDTKAFLTHM